jgi:hypothetical protein
MLSYLYFINVSIYVSTVLPNKYICLEKEYVCSENET